MPAGFQIYEKVYQKKKIIFTTHRYIPGLPKLASQKPQNMKITILNGAMDNAKTSFTDYMDSICASLSQNHQVEHFIIQEMNLNYCTGCWTCWWKTPGKCVFQDGAEDIFRSVIHSDLLLFASPLIAGFTTSALKKITDRLIVLLHPYILLKNGESHHKKRYDNYPALGLLLQKEEDTDEEDLIIIRDIYDRLAINFHSEIKYLLLKDKHSIEEIIHENSHI